MLKRLKALIDERFNTDAIVPEKLPNAGYFETMLAHRSHRSFRDEQIPEELMQFLFYCALSAPSKSDLQQGDIIWLKNPDIREQIEALTPSMHWMPDAPELLVFCGNNRRIREMSKKHKIPFANDHVDSFMNAAVDAGILMMNFIRAAEAAGLGCCPISVIRNEAEAVGSILDLPDLVFPLAGLAVGYPASDGKISARLPVDITIHVDQFRSEGNAEAIQAYDNYRRERRDFPQQRYNEDYADSPSYSWSEDKARQYGRSERADFGSYLKKHGFRLI